ncbi:30S ribosomal protein S1 [Candidatus Purcelliella pentastirinorum]|uniref:30S ribosomal protein S1 n=1 Tax=Candidatus Purcelliella pentastirinorum TaxID=472834 RepID=A0AAX3N9F8_9ENTR|nr:30S ribosomal protein S1 [Candidatus Purcelliella pentastirinorum]WDI78490.1 30S ribosomal protein S1 [Candidatus Purcelliella pentastirinorum]WDR80481.1 30S ribosomal protein S1 [Candidatus Purcelliella pentastirinorum]
MIKSFSELFEKSFKQINIRPGSIIQGIVISIEKDVVLVDAGLKSESAIPLEQFKNSSGDIKIEVGEKIDVVLDAIEDGFGETILSREKAKRYEIWLMLEKIYNDSEIVTGVISGRVKGGFTVELENIRAFLPGSLVDIRPIRDTTYLEGQTLEFKVIKLDKKRNNVVVSRKAVIESFNIIERNNLLESLYEGMDVKGIVKNLTDYGAFIDLGGVDGLLHITDMSWKRVKHPSEIVSIGDEFMVKILKFDRTTSRVSLGLKQLSQDPWFSISELYPEKTKLHGKVTNITDYGCFVEIREGVEGLVHVSEMDWTNRNFHPSKFVNIGDILEVMVLNIDVKKRRISLGLKQCTNNPWEAFAKKYKKGDIVKGKIKSITDFGIFIGLENNIDGLIHLSDISWDTSGKNDILKYKKGEKISSVLLQIDIERERISLGIKQLKENPIHNYLLINKIGSVVHGVVLSKNVNNVIVSLSQGVNGILNNVNPLNVNINLFDMLKVNDVVKVKIIGLDKTHRLINLFICIDNDKDVDDVHDKKHTDGSSNFSNIMTEAFKAAKND